MAFDLFRTKTVTPRLERLRGLALFVDLTPAELVIVDSLLHERDYLQDEVIFDQGDDGQAIYFVLDGTVLIRRDPLGSHESGPVKLAELGPGDVFGDIALLDNAPRRAQAVAAAPCHLAVFFREDFMGLLDTHARIATKMSLQLARNMAQRLRNLTIGVNGHQHL